jgi:tRNA 2-thiouridine synthesizing protein E
MLDINKSISNPARYLNDPEGNLTDLASWSPQHTNQRAQAEGLTLGDEHWVVIYFLRERFRERGNEDPAREILHELEERFCDGRGRASLYELFPQGPVSQGSRLAGLPPPPHSYDLSFGSMM